MDDSPYFDAERDGPSEELATAAFIDFLGRLRGPAAVKIDTRQEMLVLLLRSRCLRFAVSSDAADVALAVNQLCAIYEQSMLRRGRKTMDVFGAFLRDHIRAQEQVFLARAQALAESQRKVQKTTNLLNCCHELLENFLRRLSTVGAFSLDVVDGKPASDALTPEQYLDIPAREKSRRFEEHPSVVDRVIHRLFGAIDHGVRNSIAHRRYEVHEDGSVTLFDFHPKTRMRRTVARMTQDELVGLAERIDEACTVLEISLLVFQHNHFDVLALLGHQTGKDSYSDKEIAEALYMEAPTAYLRVTNVSFDNDAVAVDAGIDFPSSARDPGGTSVQISSTDRAGRPIRYELPFPPLRMSARNQALRFLQKASLYCGRYATITLRVRDADGSALGEFAAPMGWVKRSVDQEVPIEEFLSGLTRNTFS